MPRHVVISLGRCAHRLHETVCRVSTTHTDSVMLLSISLLERATSRLVLPAVRQVPPADILPPQRLLRHPKLASRTSAAGHNSNPKPNRLSFRDTAATRRRHYIGHVSRLPATRPEMLSLAWVPRAGKMKKADQRKHLCSGPRFLALSSVPVKLFPYVQWILKRFYYLDHSKHL